MLGLAAFRNDALADPDAAVMSGLAAAKCPLERLPQPRITTAQLAVVAPCREQSKASYMLGVRVSTQSDKHHGTEHSERDEGGPAPVMPIPGKERLPVELRAVKRL